MSKRPRLLIEDWLPAQAIGVECMRARGSASALEPTTYLHIWWARRPLTISRAAVLGSLLPADFDHSTFERLLGFYDVSERIIENQVLVDKARATGIPIANPHGPRAFNANINEPDLSRANQAMENLWQCFPIVIDPMAGGGSIPLEAVRLGLQAIANEYNPVACSVLEATVDYPLRLGAVIAKKARKWAQVWRERFNKRMESFYAVNGIIPAYTYIFARTVPCPSTPGHPPTPLVPDWSLLRVAGETQVVAEPVVLDASAGKWTIRVREVGKGAGQLRQAPPPTYGGGKGISLYTHEVIPSEYIKAQAQQGRLGSALYAVATKVTNKFVFRPAESHDMTALAAAEAELIRQRPVWESEGIIPTELYPVITSDSRPRLYGMPRWADMYSPRQLLAMGVLVEELRKLHKEIIDAEAPELGEGVHHLLAFILDKFLHYNNISARWHPGRATLAPRFDRHDYSFRPTFAELAACVSGAGLSWAMENVIEAYEHLVDLPKAPLTKPVTITQGNAANLPHLEDSSMTAVVVDPPYADNVQYSELADFFYVWLKRTQGHRRPEWFSSYLCEHSEEAVVNASRFASEVKGKPSEAKAAANAFYQHLMTQVFVEAHRILRDDGALTVMFTHKQQSAWAALFEALIAAGFTITATWPVQTESQHSLHQAKKNAAQSTVVLVARKRDPESGLGFYTGEMQTEIRQAAQTTAQKLDAQGLNPVDQLVGAFGPAMEVYTRYREVHHDTGQVVKVEEAIQTAADAVAEWRIMQLAKRGLEGVDPESRFVLLCWDVMSAAEFRFNEAMMLGRAVGMDVNSLLAAGLLEKQGEKVRLLPASARRREEAVLERSGQMGLFGAVPKHGKAHARRKIHPGDAEFASAVDACHALALRWAEGGYGEVGLSDARKLAREQKWDVASPCARLMEALVLAAPEAVRFAGKGAKKTAADTFYEFRAWHHMLKPIFGIEPSPWVESQESSPRLPGIDDESVIEDEEEESTESEE